ncbi:MAG: type II toxin-antitoxin system VapC family toxin [Rhodothermales bacterium]|nr:type II toxin-antitoxin system VapC family toxin [Rhodothermales bacterium]MBO6780205.1 type II toxin-antitoxin system VapC family toxin [Rhodothermales bacterium]
MVIDANVLAAYYLARDPALRVRLVGLEWYAPPIWRSEFMSTLRSWMVRRKLSLEAAVVAHGEAEVEIIPAPSPDAAHVFALAEASGCSTYDCEYLAAAQMMDVPLLTLDAQVLRAFPQVARTP